MDANTTYELLVAAIKAGDVEAAAEHAANLAEWVGKGCFLPEALAS